MAASISSSAAAAAMIIHHHRLIPSSSSSSCSLRCAKLKTEFWGGRCGGPSSIDRDDTRISCWFRFGGGGKSSRRQSRDDFDRDDVEQYFNYMGMLAVEGSYDKMEALLKQDIHPVDVLLLLAASEGDQPKVQELLTAGADYTVKDADGRTALDRAAVHQDLKPFMLNLSLPNPPS